MSLALAFFESVTNSLEDGSFERGALAWDVRTPLASVTDSSQLVTTPIFSGAYALRMSCSANASAATIGELVSLGWRVPAVAGDVWSAGGRVFGESLGFFGRLRVRYLDAALATLAEYDEDTFEFVTNLITNPNFETNVTGWTAYDGGVATVGIAQSAAAAKFGTNQLLATRSAGSGPAGAFYDAFTNSPGARGAGAYTVGAWVRGAAGVACTLLVQWTVDGVVGQASVGFTGTAGSQWVQLTYTIPPGALVTTHICWVFRNTAAAADTIGIDGAILVVGSVPNLYFFDGGFTDGFHYQYDWTGTANASTSTRARINVETDAVSVNHFPNPSVETGTTGYGGSGTTLTRPSGVPGGVGGFQLRSTHTATPSGSGIYTPTLHQVVPGRRYTARLNLLTNSGGRSYELRINFVDANGSFVSTAVEVASAATGLRVVTGVAPQHATQMEFTFYSTTAGLVGDFTETDATMIVDGDYSAGPYFDGSFPGAYWVGAANNSASVSSVPNRQRRGQIDGKTAPGGTAFVELAAALVLNGAGAGAVGAAYFDELILCERATCPEFFNGEYGNARWLGAPFASASQRNGSPADLAMILDWVPPYWYQEVL